MTSFYLIALATTVALASANASANAMTRTLQPGGGFGGGVGGGMGRPRGKPSIEDLEEACELLDCEPIDQDTLDCNIERPERPDFTGMTSEQIREAWSDMKAAKEERREQILTCGCCTDNTFEYLLSRGGGGGGRFGGGGGHGHRGRLPFLQDVVGAECEVFDCEPIDQDNLDCDITRPERPDTTGMTLEEKREAMRAMMEERRHQMLSCACCTDETLEDLLPQGFGGGGGPRHHGSIEDKVAFIQEMAEDKCEVFDCDSTDEDLDCDIERPERPNTTGMTPDEKREAMMNMKAKKMALKQQIVNCVCCAGATFEDLIGQPTSGDEIQVAMASFLTEESAVEKEESAVETEGSYLNSSSTLGISSLAMTFAAVGVLFIIV